MLSDLLGTLSLFELLEQIKASELYADYVRNPEDNYETDREFWSGTMNIKRRAVSSSRLSISPTAMRNSLREFDQ